jgi:hypothetical protein
MTPQQKLDELRKKDPEAWAVTMLLLKALKKETEKWQCKN